MERDLFPALLAQGQRVQGFAVGAYWADVGTPARYRQVVADCVGDRLPRVAGWPRGGPTGGYCHPTAQIDGTARLIPPFAIGAGCRVGPGATVADTILWDEVHVAAGAQVQGSILGSGVVVARGLTVEDIIAGSGVALRQSPLRGTRIPATSNAS